MARLPVLVTALTAADGRRGRETIDNIARAIREDGLLPATARGRGASPMTVTNAADLLIAVVMPVPRGQAAAAATEFRTLHVRPHAMDELKGWQRQLADVLTFGAALEVLIAEAGTIADSLTDWSDRTYPQYPEDARYKLTLPKLTVGFVSPLRAYIALEVLGEGGPREEFRLDYGWNVNLPWTAYTSASLPQSDWEIETRIHLGTIWRLHDALFATANQQNT